MANEIILVTNTYGLIPRNFENLSILVAVSVSSVRLSVMNGSQINNFQS